jgi:hypothetical protein
MLYLAELGEEASPLHLDRPAIALTMTVDHRCLPQVARLVCVKRLLLASHVACLLGDEPLVSEGGVRAHHMLGPLVACKARSPMLLKALASVHVSLGTLANLVQNSCVGQETNRLAGARVAAALTYHAVAMATKELEGGAAAYLARLQVELLKVCVTWPLPDLATHMLHVAHPGTMLAASSLLYPVTQPTRGCTTHQLTASLLPTPPLVHHRRMTRASQCLAATPWRSCWLRRLRCRSRCWRTPRPQSMRPPRRTVCWLGG